MKSIFAVPGLVAALALATGFLPAAAQYNAPPPPEQQNTGEAPDQNTAPPPDQNAPPPMDDPSAPPPDQNAPPPPSADQGNMQDQNAPPADQGGPAPGQDEGAPPPDAADNQGAPPPDQSGDSGGDVNFQTFYDNLSSQGNWVQTDNYGYVWQPNESDPGWAPYTDGHWVYTDEGWTWVADQSEPWGWATYHYGRWANLDGYGWVWVPGYTWAPAWVSWRYGGGYCGWAPLPPDTFIGIDVGGVDLGFHIGDDCDTAYDIGPGWYNFLPVAYLGIGDYRHHYYNRNGNFALINRTRNVTNINVNNTRGAGRFSRVTVGGPDITRVNAESTTPVQQVSLARSGRAGASSLSGNRLTVFAPHVTAASTGTTFRPRSVAGTVNSAQINNGTNINAPLQVTSRVHGTAPTSAQIAAANSTHFSSAAQIATPGTHPATATTFNRPITTFQAHNEVRTARTSGAVNSSASSNTGVHAENSFTGEPAATHHTVNHPFTPGSTEVHHATTNPTFNNTGAATQAHNSVNSQNSPNVQQTHDFAQPNTGAATHHETAAPEEHSAPVQHNDFHPEEHHESAPVQHQESHPQPQAQHSRPASQPHPSGGNGGGNHSSGGNNNGNDNKQH